MIVVQLLLHTNWKLFKNKKNYRLSISFKQTEKEGEEIKQIFDVEHFHKFHVARKGEEVFCDVTIYTAQEFSSEQLNDIMRDYPFISSVQRIDEE